MIPITYFRSSSLNTLEACEHQYFLQYALGLPTKSNQKADMGTMVHKILEILAVIKKEFQDKKTQTITINDDCIGKVTVDWEDFVKITQLSDDDIDKINKTRKNKQVYPDQLVSSKKVYLEYGHKRSGREFVKDIIIRVHEYYVEKFSQHKWQNAHKNHIINWTWMTLDYKDGLHDPRKKFVVQPEQQFDITLPYDWSSYYYELPEGNLSGNLSLKGTIDLITKDSEDDDLVDITDYKTGQRKNWVTGERKTVAKLQKDIQLLFYNYCIRKLFPDIEHVMITIFFIRDGGPSSLMFEPDDLTKTEQNIKNKMYQLLSCKEPKLLSKYRKAGFCNFCDFNKNGKCNEIHKKIKKYGIEHVIQTETEPNYKIGTYFAPG